jgi:hypothetical protein
MTMATIGTIMTVPTGLPNAVSGEWEDCLGDLLLGSLVADAVDNQTDEYQKSDEHLVGYVEEHHDHEHHDDLYPEAT